MVRPILAQFCPPPPRVRSDGQLIGVLTTTGESALCAGHASRRLDMPGKALITQCSALPGLLCHIVVRTVTRRPHSQFPGLLTLARQHWIVQVFQLDFPRLAVETVQAWHDAFFRHDGSARLAFDDGHERRPCNRAPVANTRKHFHNNLLYSVKRASLWSGYLKTFT